MKKVYYLQTCDTCKRILKEVNIDGFEKQEIKTNNVTVSQLEEMRKLTDSYQSLFNKRARLYKEKELKNKEISEAEYRDFILEEYTFLKRPVFILEDKIFIGNSKKVIEALKEELNS
ncbi:arsenate reductase [Tenacibaculum finnmarkense genomovar finnmarkense]|uniref:Arsenate reductase n=1 Tax=Tenacibaculum finnmarkense genomovar finnmarkense TaxID=1458503 RepID=A0AAP1WFA9_9FLAO|nr:ArsC/Spx/MgsR family protein [Tenacibaculum finnmarkense]MBE7647149.1 arsenate reductase [Tenacibaculum finnmarkense genomovar ulcerans]MBE7651535.1 arsenate reductase [Tenacibaculum finnmarkense genomovar finnmarkense]MBE7659737.1 arsenate reductase [Tenacibaculum finnmarkense genomovar finnmarkense]MBE7686925.1 arsenate reductase [Tenacibaculum finnmarkense genomovar ulcerans]MBE7694116.1 arsenate reductase [Tenacibaculum finnmarkense genomovar finnmarkense]